MMLDPHGGNVMFHVKHYPRCKIFLIDDVLRGTFFVPQNIFA